VQPQAVDKDDVFRSAGHEPANQSVMESLVSRVVRSPVCAGSRLTPGGYRVPSPCEGPMNAGRLTSYSKIAAAAARLSDSAVPVIGILTR
jgi:hypothetical protein